MKKIGVITLTPHTTNYGCLLQSFALQKVLKEMGNDVCEIVLSDRISTSRQVLMPLIIIKRIAMNLMGRKVQIFHEYIERNEGPVIRKFTEKFVDNYLTIREYDRYSSINQSDYDAYVVGSDQVWRPMYSRLIKDKFLEFTKGWDVLRISYAASFGTDEWEYSDSLTRECATLLKKFTAVSVREKSGIQLCREHFGVDAKLVLDPTLLLDVDEYIKLFETAGISRSIGNLHYYILDETPDKMTLVQKVAKEKHLIPFKINAYEKRKGHKLADRIQPPVEKWLRAFNDAEFVVTDSFHGCVFSILFNKQFVVYGNKNRGMSRYMSLLGIFGLENRLITNSNEYNNMPSIDYKIVNSKLQKLKEESLCFLRQALL